MQTARHSAVPVTTTSTYSSIEKMKDNTRSVTCCFIYSSELGLIPLFVSFVVMLPCASLVFVSDLGFVIPLCE